MATLTATKIIKHIISPKNPNIHTQINVTHYESFNLYFSICEIKKKVTLSATKMI